MSLVEKWQENMRKAKRAFAIIRTDRAIYDRVAIVADLPTILTVQFPQGDGRRSKDTSTMLKLSKTFSIKQENIDKRDIRKFRYYKD